MTYRSPEDTLRAESARLRAELATLRAQRARRWTVRSPGYGAMTGSAGGLALSVAQGHSRLPDAAMALAACAVVWALCFVRRVPVEGGGR